MRSSLAWRVFAIGFAAALVITLTGGLVLRTNLHAIVERGHAQRLDERAERIAARLVRDMDGRLVHEETRSADDFNRIFSGWYWLAEDGDGRLRSRSVWDDEVGAITVSARDEHILRALGPGGEALIGVARTLRVGGRDVVLRTFGPAAGVDRELERIDTLLLAAFGGLLATLAVMAMIQVRVGLRPLTRLREAIAEVDGGTRTRVGEGYGSNRDPLALDLDGLFARNARVVARARSHAADLAHALKKPLALLAVENNGSTIDRNTIAAQMRAMNALIERHLARAGSGAGERRRVDVTARIATMLDLMLRLHAARDLDWHFAATPAVYWRGDTTDLEEMLGNLLDNAGKWARSRVAVHIAGEGTHCTIEIVDDGPGLDDAQLARAAQRGQRFDETVDGSGLGLAIVADIAHTYEGTLELERHGSGGLCARLHLPR